MDDNNVIVPAKRGRGRPRRDPSMPPPKRKSRAKPEEERKPKPGQYHLAALERAVEEHEKATGENLWQHFVEQAFRNDRILVAIAKKLVPDRVFEEIEASGNITIKWADAEQDDDGPAAS